MKNELKELVIGCPYCGEHFEISIDLSVDKQQYIEDCYVCCQPIDISLSVAENGEVDIVVRHQDET